MDSPILKQIAKFLQDRKKHKHWLVIFTCMAVLVGLGTVTALKLMGQAMTRKEKVLNCSLEVHAHTEECRDAEGNLICGLADYVVHTHNDDCYDADGNVVCTLAELPAHVHTEECYADQEVLICELEEAEGHVHDEACYTKKVTGLQCQSPEHAHGTGCFDENGSLICEAPEHQHAAECYDEAGNLICGQASHTHMTNCFDADNNIICTAAEHVHGAECLAVEDTLVCELEEGADGHAHAAECYEKRHELACGQLELHTHAAECFEEVQPEAEGGEVTQRLICALPVLEEHIHSEEAGCFVIVEAAVDEVPEDVIGTEAAENTEAVQSTETAAETEAAQPAETEAVQSTEASAETETTETAEFFKACEGDGFIVSVTYGAEAKIPEEAELVAKLITPESDPEHYAERETEYKKQMNDEEATMSALLKVGFYLDGEEIEPEAPVKVTVQLIDENGLPEGMPMTVVHFADEGSEVLDGSHVEDGKTSFEMNSFSDIAIGYSRKDAPTVTVDKKEIYSENPAFKITFHLSGEVKLPEGTIIQGAGSTATPPSGGADGAQGEMTGDTAGAEDSVVEDDVAESPEGSESSEGDFGASEDDAAEGSAEDSLSDEEAGEEEGAESVEGETAEGDNAADGEGNEDSEDTGAEDENGEDAGENDPEGEESPLAQLLEFRIEPLEETSDEYRAIKEYAEQINADGSEVLSLFAVSYALTYEGEELDLRNCEVTAEIKPTKEFGKRVQISMVDAVAYLLGEKVKELSDDQKNITGLQVTGIEYSPNGIAAEKNTMYIDEGNEIDGEMQTPLSPRNGVRFFAVRASGQPNPDFEVQYYANLEKVAYDDITLKEDVGSKWGVMRTNELPVINTTGGKEQLPKNGKGPDVSPNSNSIRTLYVDKSTGKLKTKTELTKVYETRSFKYHKAPTINYVDALIENTSSYNLKEVWIQLKNKPENIGGDIEQEGDVYWRKYSYNKNLHFTNRELSSGIEAGHTYIYINQGAILRLVYDTETMDKDFEAAFYDYDIGDGEIYSSEIDAQNKTNGKPTSSQGVENVWYMRTNKEGINNPKNYKGSGQKLAFGNANTGSGLQYETWDGNLLNKNNSSQGNHPEVGGAYKGCTFGLVTGLVNGKIQYASGVDAPNLFGDGDAIGKKAYENYSLKFNRVGDTHTLKAVNGTNTNNLDTFNNPVPNDQASTHYHIWTNNFWPMDSAESFGADGHDMKFGDFGRTKPNGASATNSKYRFVGQAGSPNYTGATANGSFPESDDGMDHNSYFGMNYKVEFDLVADYVGPLEYYFFGDDDMWVFLGDGDGNGELVCDIGGVHSSVGEYLNLWDYIDKEKEKIHRHTDGCYTNSVDNAPTCGYVDSKKFVLNFFYTERGQSGSTCWMQFTLPSVSSLTPETTEQDYGHLRVDKDVVIKIKDQEYPVEDAFGGTEQEEKCNDHEFKFQLSLTGPSGTTLKDDYAYIKYDKYGNQVGGEDGSGILAWETIANGEEFTLKNGEYVRIQYLPTGTRYTLKELDSEDGLVIEGLVYDSTTGTVDASGTIDNDLTARGGIESGKTSEVAYINKYKAYELPETGGTGKTPYTMAGIIAMFGAGFLYRKKFRERRV